MFQGSIITRYLNICKRLYASSSHLLKEGYKDAPISIWVFRKPMRGSDFPNVLINNNTPIQSKISIMIIVIIIIG